MHPQHKKEHNRAGLFFVALLLVLVLVGGAKGHTQRAAEAQKSLPAVPAPAGKPGQPASDVVIINKIHPTALIINSTEPASLPPSITATAALVEDVDVDKPIFNFNAQKQWSAASLTKLVTAMSALESSNEDQIIKVSPRAIATESSAGNLVAGQSYRLADLLRAMLVFSSNDAAVAISEYFGGEKFIALMNAKAAEVGMQNTRFFDPSGLSPLNLTTAQDLEQLMRYLYSNHRNILEITREKVDGGTHPFAGEPDFLGGKTGFIDESAGNLISLFNYQNHPVLIIVLGSKQRAEDTKILKDWFLPPTNN